MTIVEKAAYLKGMAEGLGVTGDTREGKLWAALNELLADMAHEIENLQDGQKDLADAMDEIYEDLEDEIFPSAPTPLWGKDELDDEEADDEELDDEADADEEEEDEELTDTVLYDVVCPVCGEEITLDEATLEAGSIECPHCGEALEFEIEDDGEEE